MRTRPGTGAVPDTVKRTGSIVIVDQSGFTTTVLSQGADVALAKIWRIRQLLVPLFQAREGEIYKIEADNLFVFFKDVAPALEASLAAHELLGAESREAGLTGRLAVGIGIGYGTYLYLPSEDDYYGAEVNLASKLGEDIAEGGETLLTRAAEERIGSGGVGERGRRRRSRVGGVTIQFREWLRRP